MVSLEAVTTYLKQLQTDICQALSTHETTQSFVSDHWTHNRIQGISNICSGGTLIEKGGVNYSIVQGDSLPAAATAKRPEIANKPFQAAGVSLVIHPQNPFIPTTHANVRCIIVNRDPEPPIWWFGGGYDLTPYYPFDEDCQHWHKIAYQACVPFGEEIYPKYKSWCDNYFYLPHREECRGIGGLFFDDLNQWSFDRCFEFIQAVGNSFIDAYLPIVAKRKNTPYSESQRNFQLYRRGRYAEFNLLYDRGTLFGLQSKGRTESILMSLPPQVHWHYNYQTETGTREADLINYLKPRDWLSSHENAIA